MRYMAYQAPDKKILNEKQMAEFTELCKRLYTRHFQKQPERMYTGPVVLEDGTHIKVNELFIVIE